ncbi:MAG TPA: hypothetical protein VMU46_09015 [Burkholderiales bacterium]|nr:hypothetical protein [Burkholderiales bacterium]
MNLPLRTILAFCAIGAAASGCSSTGGQVETSPEAAKIAVYESEPPGHRPYSLVKRIWVTTWRSTNLVPGYRSIAEGTADFREQAVALGGDAVANFGCYRLDANIPLESNPKMYCNGKIIKYLN